MNWSADVTGLSSVATSTWMFTRPVPAGSEATHWVLDEQATEVARLGPKKMAVPPGVVEKLVPEMVTLVPPDDGPVFGETPVTVGVAEPT